MKVYYNNDFVVLLLALSLLSDPEGCWCILQNNWTHCLLQCMSIT